MEVWQGPVHRSLLEVMLHPEAARVKVPPGWDTLCAWAIWMGYTMRIGHMVVGSLYMYGTCAFGMWDRCGIHPYVWDQEGRVGGAVW